MGERRKLRDLVGVLKDRASLLKISLSMTKPASSITRAVVLRATTHEAAVAPAEYRVAEVVSLGLRSNLTASACIHMLLDRLYHTKNAFVALKCLFVLHNIVHRSSSVHKKEIFFLSPSSSVGADMSILNLSKFHDRYNKESKEYSTWVRWYSAFLEQNLIACQTLSKYDFSSSSTEVIKRNCQLSEKIPSLMSSDLLRELEILASCIEQISNVPDSLHLQKDDLLYEVMRLVCQDYRTVRKDVILRVNKMGGDGRMKDLSAGCLSRLLRALERVEDCKEKLISVFVNKSNSDGLWESIAKTKTKILSLRRDMNRSWMSATKDVRLLPWNSDGISCNNLTAVW